jgi:hypothetical protein
MAEQPDRKDEQLPERDYDPPAVEDLREDYPLATAAGASNTQIK